MTDVETIAATMSAAEQKALCRAGEGELLISQSDRGTLSNRSTLVDYSFRPARLTDEGRAVRAHLIASLSPQGLDAKEGGHPDDVAVDLFAGRMKAKLAAARAKGRGGWDDPSQCSTDYLRTLLHEHVAKGDPVDVANFCMMLAHYGALSATPSQRLDAKEGGQVKSWEPIASAPRDRQIIRVLVPLKDGGFIEGAAYFDPDAYDGTWWWDGTSNADYFTDPISECNHGDPLYWLPDSNTGEQASSLGIMTDQPVSIAATRPATPSQRLDAATVERALRGLLSALRPLNVMGKPITALDSTLARRVVEAVALIGEDS